MLLVIFGQFTRESKCLNLRKFGVSFNELRKENEQIENEKAMKEFRNNLQHNLSLQEDEAIRKVIRKYLLPLAGRTSIMNDFFNRF